MLEGNEKIELSGFEALSILCELEYLLISLRNIGAYYHEPSRVFGNGDLECCVETTRFIDENKVTKKLAKLREIISAKFDSSLGDDDMNDIERAVESIKVWERPGD
ncbi:hypothetical protein [Burkholderia sp. Bp8998]|uniref:hypothetical protein n=1 Tax=Burkholderia sp. Bp8998 TaxID=2184557 RepID=UPI000F5B31D9|nr:hypothetical protein [Burkholderia sp. Bp8998]RQS16709.1 hypothetical protein DIE06_20365 [Burkholderia sp. Bp8998]